MTGPQLWGLWLAGSLFGGWILMAVGRGDGLRSFVRGEPPAISPGELRRALVSGTAGWMERAGAALVVAWYATVLGLLLFALVSRVANLGDPG